MTSDSASRLSAALEGRYRIERKTGEGGMATVYLADDLCCERKVALNVLEPELAAVVGVQRFLAEIKTVANLEHPHIQPLFASGEADSFLFYVVPYLEGESLRERMDRENQLPVDDAVSIATSVAEGLEYAHRHGVIHCDIKPSNIWLQNGKPVISNFGIGLAMSVAGGGRLEETGLTLGTPDYMCPEQASAEGARSAASDIYALGALLHEMLVGAPPGSAVKPRMAVPDHVFGAVGKALEKEPADRFASAQNFAEALADQKVKARVGEIVAGVAGLGGVLAVLAKLAGLAKIGTMLAKPLAAAAKFGSLLLKPVAALAKFGGLVKLTFLKTLIAAKSVAAWPFDDGARLMGKSFHEVVYWLNTSRIATRGAADVADEAVVAADQMNLAVTRSFNGFFTILLLAGAFCIAAVVVSMLPLLWRLALRCRPMIFISFHHSLEPVSAEIGKHLNNKGFKAMRIPFDPEAKHQDVVARTQAAIRESHAMVCLPGPEDSFVATEVSSATTLQKAIVFAVPESGRLPNTADKRYPMFRLEQTRASRFGLLTHFLHYVSSDFRSALHQVRESLLSPFVSISIRPLVVSVLSIGAGLFLVCFFQAFGATRSLVAEHGVAYADQRLQIVLSSTLVLLGFAAIVLPVAAFIGLASRSFWRQWLGQRRARLKIGNAEFARDDWVGAVPGLEPGSPLYECLYDTAPLAHHEVA